MVEELHNDEIKEFNTAILHSQFHTFVASTGLWNGTQVTVLYCSTCYSASRKVSSQSKSIYQPACND
jgi:hypothetical protein